jgi:hypothetical protein
MHKAARLPASMDSSIQAAGEASGSINMVMVFVRSFVHFVRIFNLKGLIFPYYKVNRRYFLIHLGMHHTMGFGG